MTLCVQCDKHQAILLRVYNAPKPEPIIVDSWCSIECLREWGERMDVLTDRVRIEVVVEEQIN